MVLDLDGNFGVAVFDGLDEGIGELVELGLGEEAGEDILPEGVSHKN